MNHSENNVMNKVQFRINPRTGRNIIVGGKVWKSLSEEEKKKSNDLFNRISKVEEPKVEDTKEENKVEKEFVFKVPLEKSIATSKYIENILTKKREAEERVNLLLYSRFN
jgi:hypothetical protein